MTQVFERCQQMEAQRLVFFKDVLFSFHKCLDISKEPVLPQIYEEFHHTINNADHQKDLKWWANNHGVNMAMAWPAFEEYTEEFRDIAKGKSKESLPTGPITLLNQRPVSEDELPPITNSKGKAPLSNSNNSNNTNNANHTNAEPHNATANNATANSIDKKNISAPITVTIERLEMYTCLPPLRGGQCPPQLLRLAMRPEVASNSSQYTITDVHEITTDKEGYDWMNGTASAPKSNKTSPAKEAPKNPAQENPFEEDEWDEESGGALTDTGEPGVPVRALYDYTGAESDELSFRQGDLFEKLEDEDEQGWCKGRKDGRVGLYPANYVEPVGH
ncbi:variant SH3 domain-containing protein [Phthorimaea operculella]|nr:variant SH3 domain-containing protein [Phthorimaea operculella]